MFSGASSFDADISDWDVSSIIEHYDNEITGPGMEGAFHDATSFNQDLSSWCVSLFPFSPSDFDAGATSWTEPRPVWGTCP